MKENLQLVFPNDHIQRETSQCSRIEATYDDNNGNPRVLITSIGETSDPLNGINIYRSSTYINPDESFSTNTTDEIIIFRIARPWEKKQP